MTDYTTAQESFWAGPFGNDYTARNVGQDWIAANTALFSRVLARTRDVESVLELGANAGLNLRALATLLPAARLAAVEINATAAAELRDWGRATVHEQSLLSFAAPEPADLAFTKGVLIHINPDRLPDAYRALVESSRRYVVVAEYYNPSPVTVPYRGESDRLFKRDFAGELLDTYPELRLVDYGFAYHRDPNFPQDDLTWFLLEKVG
jgi:spore coat polysaccharide biosynthesis protein SpsF